VAAIYGQVAEGFEAIREAFVENFEKHGDVGAACCIYLEGEPVVDLWGGMADPAAGREWQQETTQLVFSATKGATAICVNRLLELGVLELDAPVARYWPEFAAAGKAEIPLRWVLSHRAGLAAVDAELTLDEVLAWDPVVEAIAAQVPNWEPGTTHGYHARSYGWILGEVVRRVTGRSIGRYFAEEIADPLGLAFWIGVPEAELDHCARLIPPPGGSPSVAELLGSTSLTARVMSGPSDLDARALARMYAATIDELGGVRLLSPETLAAACREQSKGPDEVILTPTRFGLGFSLPPMLALGCGDRSFGHPGAGGSLGLADPEARIGFGYVMNQMLFDPAGDPRSTGLLRALYECL
jgi:CubicO group peptidase (beta-lactamase class C family)